MIYFFTSSASCDVSMKDDPYLIFDIKLPYDKTAVDVQHNAGVCISLLSYCL